MQDLMWIDVCENGYHLNVVTYTVPRAEEDSAEELPAYHDMEAQRMHPMHGMVPKAVQVAMKAEGRQQAAITSRREDLLKAVEFFMGQVRPRPPGAVSLSSGTPVGPWGDHKRPWFTLTRAAERVWRAEVAPSAVSLTDDRVGLHIDSVADGRGMIRKLQVVAPNYDDLRHWLFSEEAHVLEWLRRNLPVPLLEARGGTA